MKRLRKNRHRDSFEHDSRPTLSLYPRQRNLVQYDGAGSERESVLVARVADRSQVVARRVGQIRSSTRRRLLASRTRSHRNASVPRFLTGHPSDRGRRRSGHFAGFAREKRLYRRQRRQRMLSLSSDLFRRSYEQTRTISASHARHAERTATDSCSSLVFVVVFECGSGGSGGGRERIVVWIVPAERSVCRQFDAASLRVARLGAVYCAGSSRFDRDGTTRRRSIGSGAHAARYAMETVALRRSRSGRQPSHSSKAIGFVGWAKRGGSILSSQFLSFSRCFREACAD